MHENVGNQGDGLNQPVPAFAPSYRTCLTCSQLLQRRRSSRHAALLVTPHQIPTRDVMMVTNLEARQPTEEFLYAVRVYA